MSDDVFTGLYQAGAFLKPTSRLLAASVGGNAKLYEQLQQVTGDKVAAIDLNSLNYTPLEQLILSNSCIYG
jgi:hypothetical protein